MILGAEKIIDLIINGVPARFEADGLTQKNIEGNIGIGKNNNYYFPLIENLSGDFKIEGCSVDFTIDKIYTKQPIKAKDISAILNIDSRNTGNITEALVTRMYDKYHYIISPGYQYIAVTNEKINMPLNLLAKPIPRVTMFTAGLLVQVGIVNPNYFGPLKFGIVNMTQEDVLIESGFRAITLTFEEVVGGVNAYSGYHQSGDKLSTFNEFAPPR